MAEDAPSLLIPRKEFLKSINRSTQWFRDHRGDVALTPPLPKEIVIGRDVFVRRTDAEHYTRELLRRSGIPVPGRPPLAAESTSR